MGPSGSIRVPNMIHLEGGGCKLYEGPHRDVISLPD